MVARQVNKEAYKQRICISLSSPLVVGICVLSLFFQNMHNVQEPLLLCLG
jgi:hypothetical protein